MIHQEISRRFSTIADALEFKGENRFRVNAYRRGARAVEGLGDEVGALSEEGRLTDVPGIGKGLAEDIREFLATGAMTAERLALEEVPRALIELRAVGGLGPKRLALLYRELDIRDLRGLEAALADGRVEELPGMGAKTAANIREGIDHYLAHRERMTLGEARELARRVREDLGATVDLSGARFAGSYRRGSETCGDLDLLIPSPRGAEIVKAFAAIEGVERVLAAGDTKGSVLFEGGRQVDLRVVAPESFGAALAYFTGSKEHNVRLREIAKKSDLKVNEYGVFRGETRIAGESEEEVYDALDLPWIPPEMREDSGEIEAAREGTLPRPIEAEEVLGDLHVRPPEPGVLADLAGRARARGHREITVLVPARPGDEDAASRWEAWRREARGASGRGMRVRLGVEVEPDAGGEPAIPEPMRAEAEWITAAIGSGSARNAGPRLARAMEDPDVDAIAHPTGRLLGTPIRYEGLDLDALIEAAARTGTALEIHGSPRRLDLSAADARRAAARGVDIVLGSGAETPGALDDLDLAVSTARRAWLEADAIRNAQPVAHRRKRDRSR